MTEDFRTSLYIL